MSVRNIIFDLGGVLLNIDIGLTEKAFQTLGIQEFSSLYTLSHSSPLFHGLETGRVSSAEFVHSLRQQAAPGVSEDQILEAWNAMLLDFPPERLQLLRDLGPHYRLFLLSNTNAIHLERFNEILMETRGFPSLESFFERIYFSHLLGMSKPSPEIYARVLRENGLHPQQTLFIDDSEQNITGARKLGLRTHHLRHPQTILDLFQEGLYP